MSAASSTPARRTCISGLVMPSVSLPEEVRAACAWVAERARSVRIEAAAIEEYAAGLPRPGPDDGREIPFYKRVGRAPAILPTDRHKW